MKGVEFGKSTVREVSDGYLISDLHLTQIIRQTVIGVDVLHAEKAEGSLSRFLFYVRGDKVKIKECINNVFSGKVTGVEKEMVKFSEGISYLKQLLDLAKNNSNG